MLGSVSFEASIQTLWYIIREGQSSKWSRIQNFLESVSSNLSSVNFGPIKSMYESYEHLDDHHRSWVAPRISQILTSVKYCYLILREYREPKQKAPLARGSIKREN